MLIVLYDGTCGFCDRTVRWILRRDRRGAFRFAALQSETGRELLTRAGLPVDRLDTLVLIDDDTGAALLRSAAAIEIARRLPRWWIVAPFLRLVPRSIRDAAYDLVARHRYRIAGTVDACPIPPAEWRDRFLA
jgi:predicted DCC family thiol-disulfide oxidoreductase YuxK